MLRRASRDQIDALHQLKDQLKTVGTDPGGLEDLWNKMREISGNSRFFRGPGLQGSPVDPGVYRVTMTVSGKTYVGKIALRADPLLEGGSDH